MNLLPFEKGKEDRSQGAGLKGTSLFFLAVSTLEEAVRTF